MIKSVLVGLVALSLVACSTKEEVAVEAAPVGCAENETVSVDDNGNQVCTPAPVVEEEPAADAVAEAPAAE